MKISTILDHIDSGHMALPEFQRGYVWNRDQVRGLFDSLYRRHPVGGLLVWATEAKTATHRGDGSLAAGVVKLLMRNETAGLRDFVTRFAAQPDLPFNRVDSGNTKLTKGGQVVFYDFADLRSGEQHAMFDLAWPKGLQKQLSQPFAVPCNEDVATIQIACKGGFRFFSHAKSFKRYIRADLLGERPHA